MEMATKNSTGTWLALAALTSVLLLAIGISYVGWAPADGAAGHDMSTSGYVAMTLGIVVTLALGVGLMSLMFYSRRMGHDQDADTRKDE
jgi:heme/copper-type cytochrome/quinol oxidase subunit 2